MQEDEREPVVGAADEDFELAAVGSGHEHGGGVRSGRGVVTGHRKASQQGPPRIVARVAREIALLTNPTSGPGRGMRTAAIARPRLEEGGFRVRDLVGRDADEALDLAHGAVADGVDSLVVVGGDGLVHLAVQALAGTTTSLGIIPSGHGNDVARCLGLPRTDPQLAADVVVGSRTRRIDLGRCGTTYFVTVLAAGFDAAVNHRANAMTWGRGQLRYTVATIAELRVFHPLAYTLELDGRAHEVEAMLVAVGNGPTYGGGLRIAHGALARRRLARRRRRAHDEQAGPGPHLPQAVLGSARLTPEVRAPPGAERHRGRAGDPRVRRR